MRISFRALGLPVWMTTGLLLAAAGSVHSQALQPGFGGVQAAAAAANGPDFIVGDIRIEGLQRISEGTDFNYLPVDIGDSRSAQRGREAIRALKDTGFFRDLEI